MDNKRDCDTLRGVTCDVMNCKYHGNENYCHADCIEVCSETAMRKAETYCSTFSPKTDKF